MKPTYTYFGKIIRVIDGDTLVVDIDMGFNCYKIEEHVRLFGIDTPEIRTIDLEEKAKGLEAKLHVENIINPVKDLDYNCVLQTVKPKDKYGRYLAKILIYNILTEEYDIDLTERLIKNGFMK